VLVELVWISPLQSNIIASYEGSHVVNADGGDYCNEAGTMRESLIVR
jgi:hypothetical protein